VQDRSLSLSGWPHLFREGTGPAIITLHGYGGNEVEVSGLATWLAPHRPVFSPRGLVVEHDTHRWYGQFTGSGFDPVDITIRAEELMGLVREAASHYGFDLRDALVAGFSNGAAMATALTFLYPAEIRQVAAFSGVLPFSSRPQADLSGVVVWTSHGDADPWVSTEEGTRVVSALEGAGAHVGHLTRPGGHGITEEEISGAQEFFGGFGPTN